MPLPAAFDDPVEAADFAAELLKDMTMKRMDNIRVWFNNKGWTASVGYMNAVNNLVLRASIKAQEDSFDSDWSEGFKDPSQYGISVITHPMNYTEKQLNEKNL
jgi:hypothetical protein